MNTAPLNAALINSVGAHIRATAIAVNIFIIHLLGDVPSPTLMGYIADKHSLQTAFIGPVVAMVALLCHTLLRNEIRTGRRHGQKQTAGCAGNVGGMSYFHWIAGCVLGLAWLWRLADAAVGVPKIADISDRSGTANRPAIRASALSFPHATKPLTSRPLSPACSRSNTTTTK